MFDYLLPERIEKFDKIRFVIYKIGIDEKLKEKFKKEEQEYYEQNPQYEYEDEYYSVYYSKCSDYWRTEFNKINKEFQEYLEKKFECEIDTEKNYILRNKKIIEDNGNKYLILYDYNIIEYECMTIEFNLCRINKKLNDNQYDKFLEVLKKEVKDFWIKRTRERNNISENCYWIQDEQSEKMSLSAYQFISNLENKLRFFISKVMVRNYGIKWDEVFDEESKLMQKYKQRKLSYKKDVDVFKNINNFLLSIDANDLVEVMKYEREFVDNDKINYIISEMQKLNTFNLSDEKLIQLQDISYKCKRKINVWDKCFKTLFDYEHKRNYDNKIIFSIKNNFIEEWKEFCQFRNHIAHNKFIDYKLFNEIIRLGNTLDIKINEAEKQFDMLIYGTDDIKVKDYIGGPDDYTTLEYKNRCEREKEIYKEIISLVKHILSQLECYSNISVDLDKSIEFINKYKDVKWYKESYYLDEEKGFELFLQEIERSFNVYLMNIKDSSNQNYLSIKIIKYKGASLTNYLVKVVDNYAKEIKIVIGHDGYQFIADELPEYDERLMGEWNYTFFNEIDNKIYELFNITNEVKN